MRLISPIVAALLGVTTTSAQSDCVSDAMIVFDGSGSMAEMGFNDINEPRIFEARRAMADAIPPIAENRRLGLVIYGPNGVDECTAPIERCEHAATHRQHPPDRSSQAGRAHARLSNAACHDCTGDGRQGNLRRATLRAGGRPCGKRV